MPLARNDRLQHNVNSFAITERNLMTSNKKNSPVKTLNGTSKRRGRRRKEIAEAEDKGLTKEQLEKRNRRRDNNRVAAAKLRQKKRDEMETLKWKNAALEQLAGSMVKFIADNGYAISSQFYKKLQQISEEKSSIYHMKLDGTVAENVAHISHENALSICSQNLVSSYPIEMTGVDESMPSSHKTIDDLQPSLGTMTVVNEQKSFESEMVDSDYLDGSNGNAGWNDRNNMSTGQDPILSTLNDLTEEPNQTILCEADDRPICITGFTPLLKYPSSLGIPSLPVPSPFAEIWNVAIDNCNLIGDGPTNLTPCEKNHISSMNSPIFSKL